MRQWSWCPSENAGTVGGGAAGALGFQFGSSANNYLINSASPENRATSYDYPALRSAERYRMRVQRLMRQ